MPTSHPSSHSGQLIITPDQLGLLLKGARKSRQLSQSQLAGRLGMSQNRLSELEGHAGTLSVDQLLAILGQLGLQLSVRHTGDDSAGPAASPAGDW